MFVVRPVGCADPAAARIAGTAEGVVNGVRRRVILTLEPLPTPGVHAVPRGWAEEGTWVVPVTGAPTPAQVGAALRAATGR